ENNSPELEYPHVAQWKCEPNARSEIVLRPHAVSTKNLLYPSLPAAAVGSRRRCQFLEGNPARRLSPCPRRRHGFIAIRLGKRALLRQDFSQRRISLCRYPRATLPGRRSA